jgi:hypothetical protein
MLRDYRAGSESRREKKANFKQNEVPGAKRRLMIIVKELKVK